MAEKILGGRYLVQDKIGTGGMATVYRAQDTVLGRTVAIKTMLPQYAADPSFAARFKQEAQAAAGLQSPYIVAVYDWGRDGDTYYIAMEYIRGTDLKSGIRRHGALDCKKVAQIGSQIAQALSVAHKHDIIHRDIKPQNIMVQPDGTVKVMDFGIARAKNSHLTTDNSVLGTAHYVSPEQTQGKELGPTSDIYSLGIVMYEAATGEVPFKGDDAISVAIKQVNEDPVPPSEINPAIDEVFENIILKCMQKDPRARFQSADELCQVLRDYLAGRTVSLGAATSVLPATTRVLNRNNEATTALPRAAGAVRRTTQQSATELARELEEESRRKKRNMLVVGVVVSCIALIVIAWIMLTVLGSSNGIATVPNLLGYTEQEASEAITVAGFEVGEVMEKYDASVAEGLVCDQYPSANSELATGESIDIYLSIGPEPEEVVAVPSIIGLSVEEAESLLQQNNLVGKNGGETESDMEPGYVCEQDITAGSEVSFGTIVTYKVSAEAEVYAMPDIIGGPESAAVSLLEASPYKCTVNVSYAYSSSVSAGNVISVVPSVGSEIEVGSTVTITVSQGPEYVDIPYVIGESYSSAKTTLESYGFDVVLASGCSDETEVISYSPSGSAVRGTTITLTTAEPIVLEPDIPDTEEDSGNILDNGGWDW